MNLLELGVDGPSSLETSSLDCNDGDLPSKVASARARSSHLPLTASKLAPTRCDGVHFRVPVGVGDGDASLEAENELLLEIEFVRARELVRCKSPPPREPVDVDSSSLVWYAKGPEEPDLEGVELELLISLAES